MARNLAGRLGLVVTLVALGACGGGDDSVAADPDSGTTEDSGTDETSTVASGCGENIFDASGTMNEAEYRRQVTLWDAKTIDCRLRPNHDDLHSTAKDDRPTAWAIEHQPKKGGAFLCRQGFELSGTCSGGCDYGSTAGQVLYVPKDSIDVGVDRVQTYAYEQGTICESLQQGDYLGGPHPDPKVKGWGDRFPNGFSQAEYYETNGGIMIFPDGLVGATGNQNSGGAAPTYRLPKNKVPTSVFVMGYSEIALVTIWDTDALKGQVAVFALRAETPGAHCVPYFAMPNEGGFNAIHLMGYVDLPDMKAPTAIAASGNNGSSPGGHAIGNEYGNPTDPTRNIATSALARDGDATHSGLSRDDYERRVPSSGHAVVLSRWENKVTFLDLRPLYQFVRSAYFSTDEKRALAVAGKDTWAFTFDTNPEAKPVVVTTVTVQQPTAARLGNQSVGFPKGMQKQVHAFVGNVAGELRLFDVSAFDDPARPVPPASIKEEAKLQLGRNITSIKQFNGDFNQRILVVSRADRAVQFVSVEESGPVLGRSLTDTRMGDPVDADPNDRAALVTVVDFAGGKLLNYRVGPTENNGGKPPAAYGCGPGGADATCATPEFGGELVTPGAPFKFGSTNVN